MENEPTSGIGPVNSENDEEYTIIEKQEPGDRPADSVLNVEYLRVPMKRQGDERQYRLVFNSH